MRALLIGVLAFGLLGCPGEQQELPPAGDEGAAQGLDESLSEVTVQPDEELAGKGLKVERASRHADGTKANTITAYCSFSKDFHGKLQLKALDAEGRELGRAAADAAGKTGEARWVDFGFDPRTPMATAETFTLEQIGP